MLASIHDVQRQRPAAGFVVGGRGVGWDSRGVSDRREVLAQAADEALALRGTVMLEVDGDKHRWCAACASAQGDIELRVGVPRRGLRAWRPSAGERWLRDHGFVHVLDAWAQPVLAGTGAATCAGILDEALVQGLGAPADAALVRTLVQPGVLDPAAAPPPGAPAADHLTVALESLIAAGRGKAFFGAGRPEQTWCWAFVAGGALLVEPEPSEAGTQWRYPLERASASQAVRQMIAALDALAPGADADPLFIGFIDVGRGDGDGRRAPAA